MTSEQCEEKCCDLRISVLRYGGVMLTCNANGDISRSFGLFGRISEPGRDPDFSAAHFHNKPIYLKIRSSPDALEFLNKAYGEKITLSSCQHCGYARIRQDVEAKELFVGHGVSIAGDGVTIEGWAVEVELALSPDAFEAVLNQVSHSFNRRRPVNVIVTLFGESVPKPPYRGMALPGLVDLDVSVTRYYGVRTFEISEGGGLGNLEHGRIPPFPIKFGQDEDITRLSIVLYEVRYKVSMAHGFGVNIECSGHVPKIASHFDDASVNVGFFECDVYKYNEFPKNIFYGRFYYAPGIDVSSFFTLSLRYFAEDERDLQLFLLNQENKTKLILNVNLAIKKDKLLAATNDLEGAVLDYSFEFSRDAST